MKSDASEYLARINWITLRETRKLNEKRLMQRFSLKLRVFITIKGLEQDIRAKEFVTTNICAGGAYFIAKKPFSTGTKVQVEIPWPPEQLRPNTKRRMLVIFSGEVIRTSVTGMAIAFDPVCKTLLAV
jgi:hypothetical protein